MTFAHYTMVEFLTSPFICETDVSFFALTKKIIVTEFMKSVLLQAVCADPKGTGVNWLHDREAYCLPLAPALMANRDWEDTADLVLRYCDPHGPHYSRIPKVQRFLVEIAGGWSLYSIYDMPEYHLQDHPTPAIAQKASILLTVLLANHVNCLAISMLQAFLAQVHNLGELLATQLTVSNGAWDGKVPVTGTVLEISFYYGADNTMLESICWLVNYYGHCLDPTTILEEVVDSGLKHHVDNLRSLIDVLIKHGADPNGLGSFLTPLKVSVYHGNLPVIRLVLEAGANANFSGNSPRELKDNDLLPQWMAYSNATPLALSRSLTRKETSPCPPTARD